MNFFQTLATMHPGDDCPMMQEGMMMSGMMDSEMMNGMMGGMMGWASFSLILLQVATLVLVVVAVMYLARLMRGGQQWQRSALETLDFRYASGEVDAKDYQRMKKELEA